MFPCSFFRVNNMGNHKGMGLDRVCTGMDTDKDYPLEMLKLRGLNHLIDQALGKTQLAQNDDHHDVHRETRHDVLRGVLRDALRDALRGVLRDVLRDVLRETRHDVLHGDF